MNNKQKTNTSHNPPKQHKPGHSFSLYSKNFNMHMYYNIKHARLKVVLLLLMDCYQILLVIHLSKLVLCSTITDIHCCVVKAG